MHDGTCVRILVIRPAQPAFLMRAAPPPLLGHCRPGKDCTGASPTLAVRQHRLAAPAVLPGGPLRAPRRSFPDGSSSSSRTADAAWGGSPGSPRSPPVAVRSFALPDVSTELAGLSGARPWSATRPLRARSRRSGPAATIGTGQAPPATASAPARRVLRNENGEPRHRRHAGSDTVVNIGSDGARADGTTV